MTDLIVLSSPGRRALAALSAEAVGVAPSALVGELRPLVDASHEGWHRRFAASPRADTLASMALACGAVHGLGLPKILEDLDASAAYGQARDDVYRLYGPSGARAEGDLRRLFCHCPRLRSYPAAAEGLSAAYLGRAPTSIDSLVHLLARATGLLYVGTGHAGAGSDGWIDGASAAAAVRRPRGESVAEELIRAGALPEVLILLAEREGLKSREDQLPSTAPVMSLARLSGASSALFIHGLSANPATWGSLLPVVEHLDRLDQVLGLAVPPTLAPDPGLVSLVHMTVSEVDAYDRALLDEARECFAEWLEEPPEGAPEDREALWARARSKVMRGFATFLRLLEVARESGADISALPSGIPATGRGVPENLIRLDLCPCPEDHLQFLTYLPQLADEESVFGRRILLATLSGTRAYAVLGCSTSDWQPCAQGALLRLRWQMNKTGDGVAFVPEPFMEFGASKTCLPEYATLPPSRVERDAYKQAMMRMRRRFTELTGIEIPGPPVRWTRNAYLQLMRTELRGVGREVITALANHDLPRTRLNYLRAWLEEMEAARRRKATWIRGGFGRG